MQSQSFWIFKQDLKNIDKSNFKCIQMPDQSVYYGEVALMHKDTKDLVNNTEGVAEDVKAKLKQVRHGYGIQLLGRNQNDVLCYYAGQWDRDQKQGEGKYQYPDGSVYKGEFNKDKFNNGGILTYKLDDNPQGISHEYSGAMVNGKIEGFGQFVNGLDQMTFQGTFVNNQFLTPDPKVYIDPFASKAEIDTFKDRSSQHTKRVQKLANEEQEKVRLIRISNPDEVYNAIFHSNEQNRTSIFLSSLEVKNFNQDALFQFLLPFKDQQNLYTISYTNLREYDLKWQAGGQTREEAISQQRQIFRDCIRENNALCLIFDSIPNNENMWTEMYDPDINHLINNHVLPPEIWRPQDLKSVSVMAKAGIITRPEDDPEEAQSQFANLRLDEFEFLIWSKTKFSETLSDEDLLKAFRKRFEKSLPLNNINLVFIQSPEL